MSVDWHKIEEYTLILTAITLPLSIFAANVALSLSLLLLIRRLIFDRESIGHLSGGITIPLIFYLAVDFIAVFASGYPVHIADFFEDKWVLVAYFIAFGLARDPQMIGQAVWGMLAAGFLMAVYAVYQFLSGYDLLRGTELEPVSGGYMAVGVFTHHLTYAGIALIVFLTALSRALFEPRSWRKFWMPGLILLTGVGLFVSYGRSGLIGAIAGIAVLIAVAGKRLRGYLLAAGVAGFILMLAVTPGLTERFMNAFSSGEHSEGQRVRLWLSSVEIIKHHPIFGVGQSNFGLAFEKFHRPGYYENAAHPHCDLLSVAVDGGIIALVLFCFVWVTFFKKVIRVYRLASEGSTIDWIPSAGFAVAAAILTAGLFQNYLTDAEVANMVWFTVGLTMSAVILNSKLKSG